MKWDDYLLAGVLFAIVAGIGTCALSQTRPIPDCNITSIYMTGADFGGRVLHSTLQCTDAEGGVYYLLRETFEGEK